MKVYLSDRTMRIEKSLHLETICGVTQGFVIGTTLWNLYYNGVLKIPKDRDVSITEYADSLALVNSRKNYFKNFNRETILIKTMLNIETYITYTNVNFILCQFFANIK